MMTVITIISIILAIAGLVLSFIFITPENKREKLPKFFKFLHDLFNFKYLVIEKIMQALYIFSTLFCIVFGFFALFSFEKYYNHVVYTGWVGLIVLVFGPILVRLLYEGMMMFIILVKNTNQINKKLGTTEEKKDSVEL